MKTITKASAVVFASSLLFTPTIAFADVDDTAPTAEVVTDVVETPLAAEEAPAPQPAPAPVVKENEIPAVPVPPFPVVDDIEIPPTPDPVVEGRDVPAVPEPVSAPVVSELDPPAPEPAPAPVVEENAPASVVEESEPAPAVLDAVVDDDSDDLTVVTPQAPRFEAGITVDSGATVGPVPLPEEGYSFTAGSVVSSDYGALTTTFLYVAVPVEGETAFPEGAATQFQATFPWTVINESVATIPWTGNGSENANPQCEAGQDSYWHWILTPGGNVTLLQAILTVDYESGKTTTAIGTFRGNGDGAIHFDVILWGDEVVESASVTFIYEGELGNHVLTISDSECREREVPVPPEEPEEPEVPVTPEKPEVPVTPEKPDVPEEALPVNPQVPTTPERPITPVRAPIDLPLKDYGVDLPLENHRPDLPLTGVDQSALSAWALALIAAGLGLLSRRRRLTSREDE